MATTRRILAAANVQLQAQLAAHGNEGRKTLKAMVKAVTVANENLLKQLANSVAAAETRGAEIAALKAQVAELKAAPTPAA